MTPEQEAKLRQLLDEAYGRLPHTGLQRIKPKPTPSGSKGRTRTPSGSGLKRGRKPAGSKLISSSIGGTLGEIHWPLRDTRPKPSGVPFTRASFDPSAARDRAIAATDLVERYNQRERIA